MFPYLSVTLFLPLAAVGLITIIPREDVKTIRRVALFFAIAAFVLSVQIWIGVVSTGPEEMRQSANTTITPWIEAFNVYYRVGVDGLSAPMVALTALTTLLALFYATRTITTRVKEHVILFLALETCLFGVFMSLDLVMFYVFWVAGIVPLHLLISVWGSEGREEAAMTFSLYNLLGSAALLIGILLIYSRPPATFDILAAAESPPFANTNELNIARATFLAFFGAFAIRLPLFPFHSWLSDAQTKAPTAGSVMLAAFLSTGVYGLVRIALPLFPNAFHYFATAFPILPILAVVSIIYGALVALAQWDLKRLIAYASVAQIGLAVLGVCAAAAGYGGLADQPTLDAARSGLTGAAMQAFIHPIVVGGLLLLAGMLYQRAETYDLHAFGGLARQVPQYYGFTLVAGLALLSLPGLIGFWGQLLVFKGTVDSMPTYAIVGALGALFTAGSVLWKIVQHLFLGDLNENRWGKLPDLAGWEKLTLWPLILAMVAFGVYPALLIDPFNAALSTLLQTLP